MIHTNNEHVGCCFNSLIGMISLPSFLPFSSVLASGHAASTSLHVTYRRRSIGVTASIWLVDAKFKFLEAAVRLLSIRLCHSFSFFSSTWFLCFCYHFMSTQVGRPTTIQYPWCTHAAPLHDISIQYWPCFQLICLQTQHKQFWMIWTTMLHQWHRIFTLMCSIFPTEKKSVGCAACESTERKNQLTTSSVLRLAANVPKWK